jgi:hypothetical protein
MRGGTYLFFLLLRTEKDVFSKFPFLIFRITDDGQIPESH